MDYNRIAFTASLSHVISRHNFIDMASGKSLYHPDYLSATLLESFPSPQPLHFFTIASPLPGLSILDDVALDANRNTTTVIIISPKRLGNPKWKALVHGLNDNFAIDRVVVDEAHLVFDGQPPKALHYSDFSPLLEAEFRQAYDISANARVIRAPTGRPMVLTASPE
ncbi:hypothetical protein LZ32DRAFT_650036 [Colletotrichum eremochloae]|nr:hypothetical protein LZ32DRAFT_650036 [Colletotrichum eremochloae]